jgi:cysteine desulfurase/selenocysteine lyase
MHYLNNAGAGLMSDKTLNVIIDYLNKEREKGAYRAAKESKSQIDLFYERGAHLFNASSPKEIAFVDSASRAWNVALYGMKLRRGDQIVTLSSEFGTNLVSLFYLAFQVGASVKVIHCDQTGDFDMNELSSALDKDTRLLAISHAAMQGSIVNPVKEIGRLAKEHSVTFLLDGCQVAGQIPIDVKSIECDVYTTTGRKWLRGPRGTGLLFVSNSSGLKTQQVDLAVADLVLDGESRVVGIDVLKGAKQFELWERSIAAMLGLSTAVNEYFEQGREAVAKRVKTLSNRIRKEVSANPNLALMGKVNSESGVVGFYVNDPKRENHVREKFEQGSVEISTVSDWDCPLHFPRTGITSIFRLSPHYYTPDSSVDAACQIISEI